MQKTSGFTLIELVMIIVIIGILAAAALPRFFDAGTQAKIAANRANAGALRSAVNIAHAAWIAQGASTSGITMTLDGSAIQFNSNGWPSYWAINGSTIPTYCANTIQFTNPGFKPFIKNFPQVVTSDGTVGGSCQSAPCACTEDPCYIASTPVGGTCLYTLNDPSNSYTITYVLTNGRVTASP